MSSALGLPVVSWARAYFPGGQWRRAALADILSGVTVGAMSIPQNLGYAAIAGVSPIFGLYSGMLPAVLYFLLGSSPHLIVGPTAVLALVAGAAVETSQDEAGTAAEMADLAVRLHLVAFLSGVLQVLMSIVRIGLLTNFLSHPVMAGFTSGAGIIIAVSQFKTVFGVQVPRSKYCWKELYDIWQVLDATHLWTLVFSLICVLVLVMMRHPRVKKLPAALMLVVVATFISYVTDFHERTGIALVGDVPSGLPSPAVPDFQHAVGLMGQSVPVALISLLEAVSIGKTFAIKYRYELNANQDLLALGVANTVGSFFLTFPTTGSFSRTAVNANGGGQTRLANLVSAIVILFTCLWLTSLIYFLPKGALAAIIVVASFALVEIDVFRHLYRADPIDCAVFVLATLATIGLGVEYGIATAFGISLVAVAYRYASLPSGSRALKLRKPLRTLDVDDDGQALVPTSTGHSTSIQTHNEAGASRTAHGEHAEPLLDGDALPPRIVVVSLSGPLFFLNAEFVRDDLNRVRADGGSELETIIIDLSAVHGIDSSGVSVLSDAHEELSKRDVALVLAGTPAPVRSALKAAHVRLPQFDSVALAVAAPRGELLSPKPGLAKLDSALSDSLLTV